MQRFTADVSHELRTPLTAIRTVGEVALRDTRSPDAYREIVGSMLEEVDRLTCLVDRLLTLSRAGQDAEAMARYKSLLADNLTTKANLPPAIHLSPGVVMLSNLHLFREMRQSDAKLGDLLAKPRVTIPA